jgi:Fe/S biogenesis protein NfuA
VASDTNTDDVGPDISMTEPAIERLQHLIANAGDPPVSGIRLQLLRRTPQGFDHQLTMVDEGSEPEDDYELDFDGLMLYVDPDHAEYLDGLAVHWEFKGEGVNGFEFDNPNPRWHEPLAEQVQVLFDEQINPGIAAHGGFVDLLGVEGSVAYIRLGGGCQGCGLADVTLRQGIEVAIKETVPEIEDVVDATNHAEGSNPYFQPSKK